jgi:membrane-associated phospholipid phosphatase
LFLMMFALPAFCEGFAPAVSVPRSGDHAAPLSPAFDLLALGPFRSATTADADVSVPTASRTWHESVRPRAQEPRGLARLSQHLVDPRVVGPALLATYVTGRISGLPNLTAASARVVGATFSAAVLCEGLSLPVGSARSDAEAGASFDRLDAWHPSEHTTIAFAAAAAIDEEFSGHWVPWVVYPVAAVVGLDGMSEDHHRLTDIAAGAALGFWTGRKVDQVERGRMRIFDRARFLVRGSPSNFRVGFKARF